MFGFILACAIIGQVRGDTVAVFQQKPGPAGPIPHGTIATVKEGRAVDTSYFRTIVSRRGGTPQRVREQRISYVYTVSLKDGRDIPFIAESELLRFDVPKSKKIFFELKTQIEEAKDKYVKDVKLSKSASQKLYAKSLVAIRGKLASNHKMKVEELQKIEAIGVANGW